MKVVKVKSSKYRDPKVGAGLVCFWDGGGLREAGPELEQHGLEAGSSKWCRASRSLYLYSVRGRGVAGFDFFFIENFIYVWLCWVFIAVSLLAVSGLPLCLVHELLTVVACLVAEHET